MTNHKLISGDSKEVLKSINNVNLVVTSPPYNVGKEYELNLTIEEYEQMLIDVYTACYNSMIENSRICVNVPYSMTSHDNTISNPYITNYNALIKSGFKYKDTITWNQNNSGNDTAWGSWCSPSSPWIRHQIEVIIIMYKGEWKLNRKGKSDLIRDEFLKYVVDMWSIPPSTINGHPAIFPEELPKRCIKLFSYIGDTILDPFVGSGTTSYVAKKIGRNSIGIDLRKDYIQLAKQRLSYLDGSIEQEIKPILINTEL